jgi:hypothetical protein
MWAYRKEPAPQPRLRRCSVKGPLFNVRIRAGSRRMPKIPSMSSPLWIATLLVRFFETSEGRPHLGRIVGLAYVVALCWDTGVR